MLTRGVVDCDFVNYKFPSLFIASAYCDFKCAHGMLDNPCQNSDLMRVDPIEISSQEMLDRFRANPITKAVVFGGLEPAFQFVDILHALKLFRNSGETAPFVIYTGYYPQEVLFFTHALSKYPNVIVKYGRFIPHKHTVFDSTLGVTLASNNQFAIQIS